MTLNLAALAPELRIVGYSLQDDPPTVRRFMEAGGDGFVSKEEPPEALIEAIEHALAGGIRVFVRNDLRNEEWQSESQSSA